MSFRITRAARVAAVLASGLVVLPGIANAGQSAPTTPDAGGPPVVSFVATPVSHLETFEYGDTSGEFPTRDITLGPATRAVTVTSARPAAASTVTCDFNRGTPVVVAAAVWNAAPVRLAVPAGSIVPEDRSTSVVRCTSLTPAGGGWELTWQMLGVASAPSVVKLDERPEWLKYHTISDRYTSKHQTVYGGDRMTVRSTPGAFSFLPDAYFEYLGGSIPPTDPDFWESIRLDGSVKSSADGSALILDVPGKFDGRDGWEGYLGRNTVTIGGISETVPTATTPSLIKGFDWTADVTLTADRPSATKVSLGTPVTLSFLRTRATVTVTAPNLASPTGQVTVIVDGVAVGSVALTATSRGRATIALPALPRGVHTVTTRFTGSSGFEPSVASPVRLRVLF